MLTLLKVFATMFAVTFVVTAAEKKCHDIDRKNPQALLAAMDSDMDLIEKGRDACGSFTDYFAMNVWDAIKLGVPVKSITPRVNRLLALADKKIYLSSYEKGLAEDGGIASIKKYMDDMVRDALLILTKDSPQIPEWVQKQLAKMKAGKPVKCSGTLGCGNGVYRLTEGREIPFHWYSYTNSDGWEQIALTTRIYGYDRRSIQALRDQLGRRGIYGSWSSEGLTWIGLTNDLWVRDDLQNKYMHVKKWTLTEGGKVGEYSYHHAELKRDYLDRLTAATGGHVRFSTDD